MYQFFVKTSHCPQEAFSTKWVLVLFFFSLSLLSTNAFAQEESKALEHFETAERHYKLKEFEQAIIEYKEAFRVSGENDIVFNIAQCHFRMEQYKEAIDYYKAYLRDATDSSTTQIAKHQIEEAKKKLAAKEEKNIDIVDPVEKIPAETQPTSQTIVTEKTPKEFSPSSEPSDRILTEKSSSFSTRTLLLGGAGGSIALSLALGGFSISHHQKAKNLTNLEPGEVADPVEARAQIQKRNTLGALSTGFLLAGILSGGTGLFLIKPEKKEQQSMRISFSPSFITLSGNF